MYHFSWNSIRSDYIYLDYVLHQHVPLPMAVTIVYVIEYNFITKPNNVIKQSSY